MTCRHLGVFVACLSSVDLYHLRLKARVLRLIQDRLNLIKTLLAVCLGNHSRDQLHLASASFTIGDFYDSTCVFLFRKHWFY